jgi:hypothetical protein
MSKLQTCKLGNMCNALLEYYNTSILSRSDMDESLKKACYVEAKKCADKNRARSSTLERTVLKELIVNHKNNSKPIADYIAGPYSLSLHWSEVYKKLIYIFGEAHEYETDCDKCNDYDEEKKEMLIEDYLEQLFMYSDAFIDFYHEYDGYYKTFTYEDPSENNKKFRLYKIWEKIKACVDKSTRDLPGNNCQKGRMHYIDIRTMNGIKVNNTSAFSNLYDEFEKVNCETESEETLSVLFNEFFNDEQIINLLEDLSKVTNDDFYDFFEHEFNHYEIYNKQVGKSNIKDKIQDFIKENLMDIDKRTIDDIIDSIKEIILITNGYKTEQDDYIFYEFNGMTREEYVKLKFFLGILSQGLVDVNYLIVDGYLLGRIFKTFDINTQDPNKQRPTDEPTEPHNIIIYAGNDHANNYRIFLDEKLNFITIGCVGQDWRDEEKENPIPGKCIDMEDFPQPFFSNMDDVNWLSNIGPGKLPPDKLGIKKGGISKKAKPKAKGGKKRNMSQYHNSFGDEMKTDYNSSVDEIMDE